MSRTLVPLREQRYPHIAVKAMGRRPRSCRWYGGSRFVRPSFLPMRQSPLCVLIVGDDPTVVQLIDRILKKTSWKCRTDCASNSSELIRILHRLRPDIVVLDLDLSEESSLLLYRDIHESDWNPKILCVNGNSTGEIQTRILNSGASAILTKPFKAHALVEKIQNLFPWL